MWQADGKWRGETGDGRSNPQWADRSDVLYVSRTKYSGEVDWTSWCASIWVSSGTPVAKSEFAGEFALSPDGQWLAFGERFHAYVTPLPQAGKPVTIGKKWMRCR
jgi:dipeptidyl aminopeptidase/acylaminoacyl peptidase